MSTETIPLIAIEPWCWFAELEGDGNILRIEKAKKIPDEDIQHLLDLAGSFEDSRCSKGEHVAGCECREGCELLSDELDEDHWFLEQKARFRRWRLNPEAEARIVEATKQC